MDIILIKLNSCLKGVLNRVLLLWCGFYLISFANRLCCFNQLIDYWLAVPSE